MEQSTPWSEQIQRPFFPSLDSKIEVDAVVVGGGIAGVMMAYELTKAGKKVALIEKNRIAEGSTGWTTAFVTHVVDASLKELSATFGEEKAELVWKSGADAIAEIERIVKAEKINCDFMRCPAYIFASDEGALPHLHEEEELAKKFGFPAHVEDAPLGFSTPGYLQVDQQAKFHPVKFLTALAKRTEELGAHVFEHSEVLTCSGSSPCIVKTAQGEIRATHVVLVTELPLGDVDQISLRLISYQTYCLEAQIPSGILPNALFWDTQKPYHYFRVDRFPTHDRLIIGGEDHKTGETTDAEAHFLNMKTFLEKLLPGVDYTIVREWSGTIFDTIDGLPFIGNTLQHKNQLIACGFSGNGMTFGVISAMVNRDLILGKKNSITDLYRTTRTSGLGRLMSRGLHFISTWINGRLNTEKKTLQSIKPDDGAVVEINGKKVAVYKDAEGQVLKLSPVCTHLKCIVQWNSARKTWDCPCHGSCFRKSGEVENGPATKPLEKID